MFAKRRAWNLLAILTVAAAVVIGVQVPGTSAHAAAPLTVAQAIGQQTGATGTVRGYVVGQPTGTTTVIRSGFPNDYALALADSPSQTSTSQMIYVQITSAFRSAYGLQSNPGLMGKQLDVTGKLSAYFSHAGLTATTAFALVNGTTTTTTPPTTTTTPGDYDGTYYRTAIGLSGTSLKNELNRIISAQTKLSYDAVWNALKATDEDPSNPSNVILLYSGRSQSKSTNGGGVDDWNREHVWAKSHGDFGTATGPGTDVHHLRPEDVTVNSNRGNKDFDNGGSPAAECPDCFTDADSWEPRDAVKGDVARMIFYMAVRYAGTDGWPDLEVNNSVNNGSAPYIGKLTVLKTWSQQDPPDAFEKRRNQVIYDQFQHNRNPFIDHPEWVTSIWG
ncbi:endonuclease [Actinokineospora sp. HUAS TT18]|uniref:endonuclease n=1 Tax=Actinokineospora sp. HUAS TT18 TaxID=3447451 RepID=UPI003F51B11C